MLSETTTMLLIWGGLLLICLIGLTLLFIRRRQSRQALVRRVNILSALAQAGRGIVEAEQKDEEALLERIFEQISLIVDTQTFQLGVFDGDDYHILFWTRQGMRQPRASFTLTDDNPGIVGYLRDNPQPILIRDYATEADKLPARPRYFHENSPRSAVFVPMLASDEAVGVLAIQSWQPAAFSQDDVELLSIIANQAGAALRNAQVLRQLQHRTAALELLVDASRQLNALQPVPDLAHQIAMLVKEAFDLYGVHFFLVKDRGADLVASTAPGALDTPYGVPIGAGLVGTAAQGEIVLANRATEDERFLIDPALPNTLSELVMPVRTESRVLAVLDMQSDQPDYFDAADLPVYQALADQLALAMLEAEHWQAQQHRADQLAALAEISRAATGTLVLEDLLDDTVDLIHAHFGYDRIRIFLTHEDHLVLAAGVGAAAQRALVEGLRYHIESPGLITHVARHDEPALVDDVTRDERYQAGEGLLDTRSELAVPLSVGRKVLGVLDIQSPQRAAFTTADQAVLQTLADNTAVAVRNAQLYERERRRRLLSDSLREISAAITSTLDLDVVFARILAGLSLMVPYKSAGILLTEGDRWVLRAAHGLPDGAEALIGQALDGELLANWISQPDQASRFTLPPEDPITITLGLRHGAGIMLGSDDLPLGLLLVGRSGVGGFSTDDAEVIETFGGQAAIAIKNANLFVAQREEAWISNTLLALADAIASTDNLDHMLGIVTHQLPRLVSVGRSAIMVYNDDAQTYTVRAAYNCEYLELALTVDPAHLTIAADDWPPLQIAQQNHSPIDIDVEGPKLLPGFLKPDFTGDQPAYLLSMRSRGHVAGVLIFQIDAESLGFNGFQHELLNGIANQAATAIEAARLHLAQQEEAWVSTALLQVAEAVATSENFDEAVGSVLRLAPLLVGVRWCAMLHWRAAECCFRFGGRYGIDGAVLDPHPSIALDVYPKELGIDDIDAWLANQNGSNDLTPIQLNGGAETLLSESESRALYLHWRGSFFGLLLVDDDTVLTGRRMNILTGTAGQLAIAIENERLAADALVRRQLERELRVARNIQLSFLPRDVPHEPGWSLGTYYQPARQVGGDFYDFIPLRDGCWGLVVADVSDKGIPAALYMALCRTLLRAVAPDMLEPDRTLARINQLLEDQSDNDQFVTCFYAIWRPATGDLIYSNAGQNWPLLVNPFGVVQRIPGQQGMPLGIFPEIPLHVHHIQLTPGTHLVCYSDGITDAHPGNWQGFGEEGLKEVLAENHALTAPELSDAVAHAVVDYVGEEPPFDDMTLFILRRDP